MCERQQNLGRRAKEVLATNVADDMLPAIKGVTPAELRKSNGQTYDGWEVATDDA